MLTHNLFFKNYFSNCILKCSYESEVSGVGIHNINKHINIYLAYHLIGTFI